MSLKEYQDIRDSVIFYQDNFRSKTLGPFEMSELYDLFPYEANEVNAPVKGSWPSTYPFSERAGVYGFFDKDMKLIYIGKASMRNSIGGRLGSYFSFSNGCGSPCRLNHEWDLSPRFVFVVAAPYDSRFEAPALEEYLITKFKPAENSLGVDR